MSRSLVLRLLPFVALAVLLASLPAEARWTEEYGTMDTLGEFRGLACSPTLTDPSGAGAPRADIIAVEGLDNGAFIESGSVTRYQFNGAANEHTDPREVEDSPYPAGINLVGQGSVDDGRDVALGKAGWFLGTMEDVVRADGTAAHELHVHEDDGDGSDPGEPEPFCVYGAALQDGPFSFVGLYDPKEDDRDGVQGTSFDLDEYYARINGNGNLRYVVVMDSGNAARAYIDIDITGPTEPTSLEEVAYEDATAYHGFPPTSRTWTIDGQEVSDDVSRQAVTRAFQVPGAHRVCLYVTNELGDGEACLDVDVQNQPPEATLVADPPSPGIGEMVELDASGSTDPEGFLRTTFLWDLGDGTTRTAGPILQHRYTEKGLYQVTVTVSDEHGGTDQATLPVATENDPPTAVLEVLVDGETRLNPVKVTAEHSTDPDGDTLLYSWDFGDGSDVLEGRGPRYATVEHAYQALGSYEVTLTVDDGFGGTDGATTSFDILYEPPQAIFEGPDSILSFDEAAFTDQSTAGDHPLESRVWSLGDGSPPVADVSTLTHVYEVPGTYEVVLKVTDANGGYGVAKHTLTVENRPPTVDASDLELPPATRVPATFAVDVSDRDGEVVAWLWDFGDGTRSSDPQPRHAYATTGNYLLTLTITDDRGAQTIWTPPGGSLVITNEAPNAQMTVFADPSTPGSVRFQDASTDDNRVVSRQWFFDDGANDPGTPDATEPETTHAFPDPHGTYRVRLVVQDDEGVTWSLTRFVRPAELASGGDADGDGVLDGIDNCRDLANPDQADVNADGVGDACADATDPTADDDGDGVPNADDAFPFDPAEHADTDGDGLGDHADLDDDGDGVPDAEEAVLGTDPLSADTDGDGQGDLAELNAGTDPLQPPREATPEAEPAQEAADDEPRSLAWLWWTLGALVLVGAGVAAWLLLRRRKQASVAWRAPEF